MSITPCKDHLGNSFESKQKMCAYWGIPYHVLGPRLTSGWNLEKSLTTPVRPNTRAYKDHEGNTFTSQKDLLAHWNIPACVFHSRVRSGWTLREILTTPVNTTPACTDHLGQTFATQADMCRHWNIPYATFRSRHYRRHWPLKQSLETPPAKRTAVIKDHLGNTFDSQSDMFEYWGIPKPTFQHRKEKGWTLRKILTTPVKICPIYLAFSDDVIGSIKQITPQFYSVYNKTLKTAEVWSVHKLRGYILAHKSDNNLNERSNNYAEKTSRISAD